MPTSPHHTVFPASNITVQGNAAIAVVTRVMVTVQRHDRAPWIVRLRPDCPSQPFLVCLSSLIELWTAMPPSKKRPASAAGPMPVKKKPATRGRTGADLAVDKNPVISAGPFYIVSFGQQCFLDTNRGQKVQVLRDGELHPGDDPTAVQWQFIPVGPIEDNTFFIRNKKYQSYLDAGHSNYYLHCSDWKLGLGRADDLMKMWVVKRTAERNAFWIVSKGKGKFLDTHGVADGYVVGQAQLWGDGVNPGSYPWNLQWKLVAA